MSQTDLRNAPYRHAEEAGYGHEVEEIKEILGGEDWIQIPIQCTPKSLAAGAVYYLHKTTDERPDKTQVEVAEEFGVSGPSIRSGWKHIGVITGELPEDALDHDLPHS